MRVRQDTAPHLFAVESETDSEQWYQVFANGRSEEHTSELQSPCNLVCRLILSEEHTSELQSPCNLVCRLLLEKKHDRSNYHRRRRVARTVAVALRPLPAEAKPRDHRHSNPPEP